MPVIHLHLSKIYSPAQKQQLMSAVKEAVTEAFTITDAGLYFCITEYEKENLLLNGNPSEQDIDFFHLTLDCFAGRTKEQKENFYRLTACKLKKLAITPYDPTFILREEPLVNWGIGPGLSAEAFFRQKAEKGEETQ